MVEIRQNWNISDHCMVLLSMLLLLLSAECCRHHRETTHNNHALAHPQPHAGCVGGGRTTHCGCVPPTHFKARGKLLKKAISGQPGYHPAHFIVHVHNSYLMQNVGILEKVSHSFSFRRFKYCFIYNCFWHVLLVIAVLL